MLNTVYELETSQLRVRQRREALKEDLSQARFALREAQAAEVEYSGISAFFDKLSGKYADKAETLSRQVRTAEAALNALLRQKETEDAAVSSLEAQLAALPSLETLRTPETKAQWAPLERKLCAEALAPLLEETVEALSQYRSMLRGEFPVLSIEDRTAMATAPITHAERCRPLLDRLEETQPLPDIPFFRSPAAFLAAAAKHNQLDRAAAAQAQTEALQKLAQLLNND